MLEMRLSSRFAKSIGTMWSTQTSLSQYVLEARFRRVTLDIKNLVPRGFLIVFANP